MRRCRSEWSGGRKPQKQIHQIESQGDFCSFFFQEFEFLGYKFVLDAK